MLIHCYISAQMIPPFASNIFACASNHWALFATKLKDIPLQISSSGAIFLRLQSSGLKSIVHSLREGGPLKSIPIFANLADHFESQCACLRHAESTAFQQEYSVLQTNVENLAKIREKELRKREFQSLQEFFSFVNLILHSSACDSTLAAIGRGRRAPPVDLGRWSGTRSR